MRDQKVARRGFGSRKRVTAITRHHFGKLSNGTNLRAHFREVQAMTHSPPSELVVLYDGVCGICNRSVQFVLRHDHKQKFRFAALQGVFAGQVLDTERARGPQTVYLLRRTPDGNNRLTAKSAAALEILDELGGLWRFPAIVLRAVPRGLRECAYDLIARNRYRWFGRYDACPIPDPQVRSRFMD
jgi:predicted DCC family thiol-disulfide oxidoreductase YuxK